MVRRRKKPVKTIRCPHCKAIYKPKKLIKAEFRNKKVYRCPRCLRIVSGRNTYYCKKCKITHVRGTDIYIKHKKFMKK